MKKNLQTCGGKNSTGDDRGSYPDRHERSFLKVPLEVKQMVKNQRYQNMMDTIKFENKAQNVKLKNINFAKLVDLYT